MQLTLGAEENISDETIPEILERLRREYTSEADAKLELERAEHAKTKEQREAAEGAWRRLMDEKHRQSSRINQLSQAAGRIAKYFVFALFFLAIVIFSIFAGESQRARAYLPAVLSVPLLIIALSYIGHLLVIAHEASGFSVKRLAEKCGDYVQLRTRVGIESFLSPAAKSSDFISLGLFDPASGEEDSPPAAQDEGSPKQG